MREISDKELIEIIQQSKLFAGMDSAACKALLSRFEKVTLPQGEILFEQDHPSDSLYALVEGHLIATLRTQDGKHRIIGIIEKGETVGEMGALSNQLRSLTVRATADSFLLKLTKNQLEAFFKDYPNTIFHIINIIISRSQTTIKILSQKKIFKHVALIQGNSQAPMHIFLNNLERNITSKSNIVLVTDTRLNLANQITAAEVKDKILVFVLAPENEKSLGGKIDHIGGIYVIVDGDKRPHLSKFALEMLLGNKTHFVTQYELVLLHDDMIDQPKDTINWLNLSNFTLHHHLRWNAPIGYQRLIRLIQGKAVGLVLGGGGGKGWASLGALKAILESNIPIDAIGGTSVGSLVAASYALHLDYDGTYNDFKEYVESATNPFSLKNLTWPIISLLSAKKPTELTQKIANNIKIENLWLPFFAVSCNLNTGKENVHRHGYLWEALRSSTSIPGLVPPVVIEGQMHVDGGIVNNLPVDIMRAMLGNESKIISVSLSQISPDIIKYNFPPILPFRIGLLRKLRLAYLDYIFPPFLYTFLNALLLGASNRENINRETADISICPDLKNYRTINIASRRSDEFIELGFQTALEQIKKHHNE